LKMKNKRYTYIKTDFNEQEDREEVIIITPQEKIRV
jgi:hypothetical protein